MKKILSFVVCFLCGVCAIFGASFLHAFAADDTKQYLIDADFESQADYYNISSSEIYDASPFDASTKERFAGKSIMPTATEEDAYAFEKTYVTNSVDINQNKSLFMYVLFGTTDSHTLQISVSDGTEQMEWTIDASTIESQILIQSQTNRTRFGWVLLELPATKSLTVSSLKIKYFSDIVDENKEYGRIFVYAPYVAAKTSNQITFASKQDYYNFSAHFGTYKYVGDKLKITHITDLVDYCYLGEIDYLKYPTNKYQFVLRVTNIDEGKTETYIITSGANNFEYEFDAAKNYELSLILYEDSVAIPGVFATVSIQDFVGIYVNFATKQLEKGKTYEFDIVVSSELANYANLTATSSNKNVATVSVSGKKLVVKANQSGRTQIEVSVLGERIGKAAQTYSASYSARVTEQAKGVNWWLMGGTAIFLIIASIVVYTIMVRRRLIKGKYPKY